MIDPETAVSRKVVVMEEDQCPLCGESNEDGSVIVHGQPRLCDMCYCEYLDRMSDAFTAWEHTYNREYVERQLRLRATLRMPY
jgi:hypothetical protein